MTMNFRDDIRPAFKDIEQSYKYYDTAFDDAYARIRDLLSLMPLRNTDVEPHVADAISKEVIKWLKYHICPNLEATRDYCNDVLDVMYEIIEKFDE